MTKQKTVQTEAVEVESTEVEIVPADPVAEIQAIADEAIAHGAAMTTGVRIAFQAAMGLWALYYRVKGGSNE